MNTYFKTLTFSLLFLNIQFATASENHLILIRGIDTILFGECKIRFRAGGCKIKFREWKTSDNKYLITKERSDSGSLMVSVTDIATGISDEIWITPDTTTQCYKVIQCHRRSATVFQKIDPKDAQTSIDILNLYAQRRIN